MFFLWTAKQVCENANAELIIGVLNKHIFVENYNAILKLHFGIFKFTVLFLIKSPMG